MQVFATISEHILNAEQYSHHTQSNNIFISAPHAHLQSSAVHSWRQLTAPSVGHNQCFIGIDLCRRQ